MADNLTRVSVKGPGALAPETAHRLKIFDRVVKLAEPRCCIDKCGISHFYEFWVERFSRKVSQHFAMLVIDSEHLRNSLKATRSKVLKQFVHRRCPRAGRAVDTGHAYSIANAPYAP